VFQIARVALERLARRGIDVPKAFRAANSELDKEDPGRLDEFERGMGPVVETARGVVRDLELAERAGRDAPAAGAHALARAALECSTNGVILAAAASRKR
jgi:citrate lyase beta subunit